MADPTKIKAKLAGDICEIKVLTSHPMETGLRKDDAGKLVPAHFMKTVTIALNGKPVVTGQLGTSVSKNPYFEAKVKGAKAGDKISVSWEDNKGDKRTDEVAVA